MPSISGVFAARDRTRKSGVSIWITVCLVLLCGFSLTHFVSGILREQARDRQVHVVFDRLSDVRARLEGELNATLYIAKGLVSFVTVNPQVTQDQFQRFASEIARVDPTISILAYAPDNVVRFVYPRAGNESVIGLDYRKNAAQWPAVQRVMEERRTVVAGPVDLIQGGQGLIARTPVFAPSEDPHARDGRAYAGVVSVVIDTHVLFEQAGLRPQSDGLLFAVRGKDGLGAQGDMILGDPRLFETDAVTMPIVLPMGTWELASRPVAGWPSTSMHSLVAGVMGSMTTVALAVLFGLVLYTQQRARSLALHDALTGLPNRRLLVDRMTHLASLSERTGIGFQVFFIDVNGFKPINDTYGHAAGDQVLRVIGDRLRAETRESDTIARLGGDEFVVVVPGLLNHPSSHGLADRLRQVADKPVRVKDHDIPLRVSVGWASYPNEATSIHEILELADQRMYRDKDRAA